MNPAGGDGGDAIYSLRPLIRPKYLNTNFRSHVNLSSTNSVPTIDVTLDSSLGSREELCDSMAEVGSVIGWLLQLFYRYLYRYFDGSENQKLLHAKAIENGIAWSRYPYLSRSNLGLQLSFDPSGELIKPFAAKNEAYPASEFPNNQRQATNEFFRQGVEGLYVTGLLRVYIHLGPHDINDTRIDEMIRFLLGQIGMYMEVFTGSHKVEVIVKKHLLAEQLVRNLLRNIDLGQDSRDQIKDMNDRMFHWKFVAGLEDEVDVIRVLPGFPDEFLTLKSRLILKTEV